MSGDARTWNDQPLVCEACKIVCSIPTSRGRVEVRVIPAGGSYYLTCGSLFGSQTIYCDNVQAMIAALNVSCNTRKGQVSIPAGCRLVEDGVPPAVPVTPYEASVDEADAACARRD